MKTKAYQPIFKRRLSGRLIAALPILVVALFAGSDTAVFAQSGRTPQPPVEEAQTQQAPATEAPAQEAPAAPKISNDQLDALVAPIALYPDPLLSQVLVASTYPLEVVQLQQWLAQDGQYLNAKAVTEGVQKQDWDPSIQAMAALPSVVKQMSDNIKWTSDLGNAFLAQQSEVMDAVQRMRTKAKDGGKLRSNEQVKVETQQVESKTVVVIEQASPEVVYVPSYDPMFVWGVMAYPYPPFYGGYYGGAAIWYGSGIAIGVAWGGGWGYGCGWGGGTININRNNNFVNHYNNRNLNRGDRVNPLGSGNNTWRHNPQHRGGAPYPNRDIANRYRGAARGDSLANRQANARQNLSRPSAGTMDRPGFGGGRDIGGQLANRGSFGGGGGGGNRPSAGTMDRSGVGGGNRGSFGGGGGGNRSLGGDRIGSRDISRGGGNRGSFGGGGSWGGGAARASSSRGATSMGGGMRAGGMRGGGMRGGGGRRR